MYPDRNQSFKPQDDISEKVIQIKRLSKKTKGGNQVSFSALTVCGDHKNRVGVALGKAKSVADAIAKSTQRARRSMITIPIVNGTIPHSVRLKFKAAIILIRPGKAGGGLIAGGPVRAVVEAAGIKDIVSKIVGSKNTSVNVWATLKALSTLKQ